MFSLFFKNIRSNLLWSEGRILLKYLGVQTFLTFLIWFLFPSSSVIFSLFLILVAEFAFFYYFFRNPLRIFVTDNPRHILSPADGKIIDIQKEFHRNGELRQRISIFLSPLDVHVQWIPSDGKISAIKYYKGRFSPAFLKKSDANERNEIMIQSVWGDIEVHQIAGVLARRISCWIRVGDQVNRGQKFGMIKFGSRVNVVLPQSVQITVERGQKVVAGVTSIGVWDRERSDMQKKTEQKDS